MDDSTQAVAAYPPTRDGFLAAYRAEIERAYGGRGWASDPTRVDQAMQRVVATLGGKNSWNWDGPSSLVAWRAIGRRDRLTLKGLRSLPIVAS